MPGPIANVETLLGGVSADIGRMLRWGKGIVMLFQVPDQNETGGLRTMLTMTKGFDRITGDESTEGDSKTVIYVVVDKLGTVEPVLRLKDLHITADGITIHEVKVSILAPNEARIFRLVGKIRTLRANFDNR